MFESSFLGKQIWNVMKVFGVAIAFYLALTVKIGLTGETDEVIQFDYLQEEVENIEENSDLFESDNSHGTSSVYDRLCGRYKSLCKKVSRIGSFSDNEQSVNFAYIIYLLQKLDGTIKRGKNPSEALLGMVINEKQGNRRGSANWDTVTINMGGMKYDKEFFQVISHEVGHIIDLGALQGVSSKKSSNYTEFNKSVFSIDDPSLEFYKYSWSSETVRKDNMTKEDFCSGYGMSDPFEDFAECHNLYLNHHDYFKKIALANNTVKNKYNYFSNLYGGKYINNSEANYENWKKGYRARDTTRLHEG